MTFDKVLAAVLLAAVPLAVQATTVVDGSFEIKGTPGGAEYCYDGFSAGGNPACGPGAWDPTAGVITSGSGAWGGTTTPAGNYFGMLQGGQILSQTVLATDNGSQQLNWIDANRTNNGGAHSYDVTVNGVSIGTFTSGFAGFVARSAIFSTVAGQSYDIAFVGIANGDTTTFIDDVSIAAVPEPATWGLMLAGFGLVGFAARRRRTAVTA